MMSAYKKLPPMRSGFLLLGVLLSLTLAAPMAWAGTSAVGDPTLSVSDLERLVQQIEDAHQREQLLKTLRALIVTVKTGQPPAGLQENAAPLAEQPEEIFFAFGLLTEHLSMVSHKLGGALAALVVTLGGLQAHISEPGIFRRSLHMGVAVGILVALGIILRLLVGRLGTRLRDRAPAITTIPLLRKSWLTFFSICLATGPYLLLLIASGIVLSVFPVGVVLSGLVVLALFTLILYHVTRAIIRVLLNPDDPTARLLPISDHTSRQAWTWSLRLINLSAAYYLVTRALLAIGVADEIYHLIRGSIVVMFSIVLTVLVARLAQAQRAHFTPSKMDGRRGPWGSSLVALQNIWPLIAIVYIWCTGFFAIAGFRQGVTYMLLASLQTAAGIGTSLLLLWAGNLAFTKAFAMNDQIAQYLPGLEVRTRRYLRTLWWGARLLIMLGGIAVVLQAWGIRISWVFTSSVGSKLLSRIITLVFTLGVVALIVDLSAFASQKLIEPQPNGEEVSKKRKTMVPLVGTVITYGALFIGGLVVLHEVGVNITPILASVGILGLAVGFGAQTLVKDIINGLFILFEDSIAVGDVVNIKGTGGLVEAVNLRTIRLRDLQGSVHIIPNSQVEIITNMTKEFSYYLLDVGVAYREDTDEVIAVLREIDAGLREDPAFATEMLAPIDILGVDQFTDSAVIIKARLKTKPIRQWYIGREFNRRMKKLFEVRGIEIPFPHRTIYWGEPIRREAPAMQLKVQTQEGVACMEERVTLQTTPPDGRTSDAH